MTKKKNICIYIYYNNSFVWLDEIRQAALTIFNNQNDKVKNSIYITNVLVLGLVPDKWTTGHWCLLHRTVFMPTKHNQNFIELIQSAEKTFTKNIFISTKKIAVSSDHYWIFHWSFNSLHQFCWLWNHFCFLYWIFWDPFFPHTHT